MNFEIRKLEDDIISILNSSGVPIEAKRLIVAEVYSLLTKESDKIIACEIKKEVGQNEL